MSKPEITPTPSQGQGSKPEATVVVLTILCGIYVSLVTTVQAEQ